MTTGVAIVTGGTRGIGLAITTALTAAGYKVAAIYHGNEDAAKACAEATGASVFKADVADYEACNAVCAEIEKALGPITALVNNAGITKDGLLMRMSEEAWDDVLRINLKSIFNLTKAASKPMMRQRDGVFINMSSVVGVQGNAGQANYAASKAGINGFTKSVAQELGSRNIRSNAIAPGFIATEMTDALAPEVTAGWIKDIPLARMGKPDDVANVCVFLASDLGSYVNGQIINVCGGMLT